MTPELLTRLRSWLGADESQYECRLSVNEVREIVGALKATDAALNSLFGAIASFKAVMGAPGDYGYETREGQALFALYRAVGQALRPDGEKPHEPEAST